MTSRSRWPLVLVFLLALGARLPAALRQPPTLVYDLDELTFMNSLLGLIGGQTPTALQWPSATLLLGLLPFVLLHFVLTSPAALETLLAIKPAGLAAAIEAYLGNAFYHPHSLLGPARLLLALATSLTPLVAIRLLPRQFTRTERVATALILATSPLLVTQTALVKGDALGALFWSLSFFYLVRLGFVDVESAQRGPDLIRGAVHLGLATASRLTHLVAWPILTVFAIWRARGKGSAILGGKSLLAFALSFLVFVPFVWTQPFTFLKALVGNLILLGNHSGEGQSSLAFTNIIASLVGWPATLVAAIGLGALVRGRHQRWLAGLTGVLFLVFLIPLSRSGYTAPHYTLPLLPVLALWAGLGVGALGRWISRGENRRERIAATAITSLLIAANCGLLAVRHIRQGAPLPRVQAARWILENTPPDARVAIPLTMAPLIPPDLEALERILQEYGEQSDSAIDRFATLLRGDVGWQNGEAVPFILSYWLADEEASDLFRYRAMRAVARTSPVAAARDVYYYAGSGERSYKPDLVGYQLVSRLFDAGSVDVLVTGSPDVELEDRGAVPAARFSSWRVYRNSPAPGRVDSPPPVSGQQPSSRPIEKTAP